ncbi:hypothetical protein [Nocardioides flavescens]|uniref:hypothetical protein n=1 Tax=Nocardioides flavescens TaxID=2691959 RepID=UPI001F3BE77D|nr:hypothetical protein [Nocardioides flavescens]
MKHGLASYPAEVTELLADFAALNVGRLEELVRVLGAPETLIRVVRTSPAEPDLAQSLASALGLPDLKALPPSLSNSSLGRDTEVLLRLNRCGRALGLDSTSAGLLAAWGSAPRSYLERPELVSKYELPGSFDSAASQEAAWLRNAPEGVTVLDPTRALDGWGSRDVPEWYADASRREACVPERLEEESEAIQLWRARQQVQVLTRRALPPETRDV